MAVANTGTNSAFQTCTALNLFSTQTTLLISLSLQVLTPFTLDVRLRVLEGRPIAARSRGALTTGMFKYEPNEVFSRFFLAIFYTNLQYEGEFFVNSEGFLKAKRK